MVEFLGKEMHKKHHAIRKDEYGNAHFSLIWISESTGEQPHRRRIRFWSREDRMFRIDEEVIASPRKDEIGSTKRMVVRPEGFVQMVGTKSGFAITNYGTEMEGREKLEVESFFQMSTRLQSIINAEVLFGTIKGVEYTNELSKKLAGAYQVTEMQEMNGRAYVTSKLEHNLFGKEVSNIYQGVFDKEHGVVLSYSLKESKYDKDIKALRMEMDYEFDQYGHIPKSMKLVKETVSDTVRESCVLESLDKNPVPLGIFALGIKSLGEEPNVNPWTVRLLIAGTGIVAIFLYVLYLRRSKV